MSDKKQNVLQINNTWPRTSDDSNDQDSDPILTTACNLGLSGHSVVARGDALRDPRSCSLSTSLLTCIVSERCSLC